SYIACLLGFLPPARVSICKIGFPELFSTGHPQRYAPNRWITRVAAHFCKKKQTRSVRHRSPLAEPSIGGGGALQCREEAPGILGVRAPWYVSRISMRRPACRISPMPSNTSRPTTRRGICGPRRYSPCVLHDGPSGGAGGDSGGRSLVQRSIGRRSGAD